MSAEEDDRGFAIERTALAWQRTGLSHVATGALCLRLLPSSPARPVLAAAMVVAGAVLSIGGRRLHPGEPHRRWIAAVSTATGIAAAAALVLSSIG